TATVGRYGGDDPDGHQPEQQGPDETTAAEGPVHPPASLAVRPADADEISTFPRNFVTCRVPLFVYFIFSREVRHADAWPARPAVDRPPRGGRRHAGRLQRFQAGRQPVHL